MHQLIKKRESNGRYRQITSSLDHVFELAQRKFRPRHQIFQDQETITEHIAINSKGNDIARYFTLIIGNASKS